MVRRAKPSRHRGCLLLHKYVQHPFPPVTAYKSLNSELGLLKRRLLRASRHKNTPFHFIQLFQSSSRVAKGLSLVPVTAVKPVTIVETQRWCRLQHVVDAGYRCVASYSRWNTSLVPVTAGKPVTVVATCRWCRLPLCCQLLSLKHVVGTSYRRRGTSNMSLGPFTAVKPETCRCRRLPLWS